MTALIVCGLLVGCAAITPPDQSPGPYLALEQRLTAKQWRIETVDGKYLPVQIAIKERATRSSILAVYIEGDGRAWLNSQQLSQDPTPQQALALQLAEQHTDTSVAYLARPCQYSTVQDKRCLPKYWSSHRFSEEVIEVSNRALERLKVASHADDLILIAYSGGATVAALLAARRDDVSTLVTIAGNLDHPAWTAHHRVSPLSGSLHATEILHQSPAREVMQIHLIGDKDRIVPPSLIQYFAANFSNTQLFHAADNNHTCCWVEQWASWWPLILSSRQRDLYSDSSGR